VILDVIILAAGKGSRMRSDIPKVLHSIAGIPMAGHVLNASKAVRHDALIHMVVGHGADQVLAAFSDQPSINFIEQKEQLGTGHAVLQVLPHLRENATTLILYGDVPLIKSATLQQMVDAATRSQQAMSLLTVKLEDPTGYGRIIRNSNNEVVAIVEHKDASEAQRAVNEANTGIMCINQQQLKQWLPSLKNDNAQGEYYLTDVIEMAVADSIAVNAVQLSDESEVSGVNNKSQLAQLERAYQAQQAESLLEQGVTLFDPARIDIRGHLEVGKDVSIDVGCVFKGEVALGDGVSIGPNCVIENSTIAAGTEIKPFSHIDGATLDEQCDIGPYARLRPGAQLKANAKVGNFVEVKKSIIGKGSKVNHLTYIGDAEIGAGSNIGAGTITCNYDGVNKHKTLIGDNVFVGSNSTLVAPLEIDTNGFIAAGSTINQKVPSDSLAVSRSKQRNIEGWKRPTKK